MLLAASVKQAIGQGNLDALREAVSATPAVLEAVDEDQRGVLHHAVLARHPALLQWLLAAEAPLLAADDAGWTVLHLAASIGDAEAASLVLGQAGAAALLNARNEQGSTPLHYAASRGHQAAVRVLLEAGADALAVNRYGQTALHRAAACGHAAVIRLLVESVPERRRPGLVDAGDAEGNTAAHMAAQDGHAAAREALAALGARADLQNKAGAVA